MGLFIKPFLLGDQLSIRLMTQVWQMDLLPSEKLVLLALADNASDEGNCYPSISTIIKKSSLSEPTVHRCIKKLTEAGFIICHYRQGRSTIYTVNLKGSQHDTPVTMIPTPPHSDTPPPLTMIPTPPHGDTHNHHIIINESSNNKISVKTPRASQLPDEFTYTVEHSYKAKSLGVNVDEELEAFTDYHKAKGSKMVDWNRAFNTWIRNSKKFTKQIPVSRAQQQQDRMINTALEWLQESK